MTSITPVNSPVNPAGQAVEEFCLPAGRYDTFERDFRVWNIALK
jgi:hypothetical protein